MHPNEEKIKAICQAIDGDIENNTLAADVDFLEMEKFNISAEEYKKASREFGKHRYIAGYLSLTKTLSIAEDEPLKVIENRLRFHADAQRRKAGESDNDALAEYRKATAELLESYIHRFFEEETPLASQTK